jgi:uncharacterized protein (DUF1330 family)
LKDYALEAQALIGENGGRFLVAGAKVTVFDGDPPKTRVAMQAWDSIEKYQAYRSSATYKELRQTGDKYAKFPTLSWRRGQINRRTSQVARRRPHGAYRVVRMVSAAFPRPF